MTARLARQVAVVLVVFPILLVFAYADEIGVIPAVDLARRMSEPVPPLILDLRDADAYSAGTIPGALRGGFDPEGFLPDGRGGIAVLIEPGDASRQAAWARRLRGAGYTVLVVAGGFSAWRAAGLPAETPGGFAVPGRTPFIIPRGLCEQNEPAQEHR